MSPGLKVVRQATFSPTTTPGIQVTQSGSISHPDLSASLCCSREVSSIGLSVYPYMPWSALFLMASITSGGH